MEILWRFMKEMKVEPDEDLVQLVSISASVCFVCVCVCVCLYVWEL